MRRIELDPAFTGEAELGTREPWGALFPPAPGLYVVTLETSFSRLRGETDILYIGQAGRLLRSGVQATLRQRWKDYWGCTTPTERDFRDTLFDLIEAGKRVRVVFTERAITPEELNEQEAGLLHRFHSDHRELPPLNRAKPGFRAPALS